MPKFIIIGPSCSGKSTFARGLAETHPAAIIYDDPAPRNISLEGSWIYIAQNKRNVPREVKGAADAVYTYIPGSAHEFRAVDAMDVEPRNK